MPDEKLSVRWIHGLLEPDQCVLTMIDHQPQMFFAIESEDRQRVLNQATALAKTARLFQVPTVLTTVDAAGFSGALVPEIQAVFPEQVPLDRTSMNAWEDAAFRRAIEATGRKRLIVAGLWTEICVVFPVIQALEAGYEVFVVADACAGASHAAHRLGLERMWQAGAVPLTWLQLLCEFQRDWSREATATGAGTIARTHAGAYGIGMRYYAELEQRHERSEQSRKHGEQTRR